VTNIMMLYTKDTTSIAEDLSEQLESSHVFDKIYHNTDFVLAGTNTEKEWERAARSCEVFVALLSAKAMVNSMFTQRSGMGLFLAENDKRQRFYPVFARTCVVLGGIYFGHKVIPDGIPLLNYVKADRDVAITGVALHIIGEEMGRFKNDRSIVLY
jgi:hypothetical protein